MTTPATRAPLDTPVQYNGNPLARATLRLMGWKIKFNGMPHGGGVMVAYPHTSNWDFPLGILLMWASGVPVVFLAKHTLFRIPVLGRLMRYWGGIAVDRRSPQGTTEAVARQLREARERGQPLWLAMAPEGTRKLQTHWRAGFYHLATASGGAIGLGYYDYRNRIVGLTEFFTPSGDIDADMAMISAYYASHGHGLHPRNASPVTLAPRGRQAPDEVQD